MDVGNLDGRGISGVDIGHDDRTTIKWFTFLFSYLSSMQTTLLALPSHYTLSYAFKLISLRKGFRRNRVCFL